MHVRLDDEPLRHHGVFFRPELGLGYLSMSENAGALGTATVSGVSGMTQLAHAAVLKSTPQAVVPVVDPPLLPPLLPPLPPPLLPPLLPPLELPEHWLAQVDIRHESNELDAL